MERRRTAAADRSATQMSELQYSLHSARDGLRTEPRPIRIAIIAIAVIFLTVFVVLPLVVVFAQAFSKGIGAYFAALSDSEALSAIRLTLLVAAISVSLNLVFGVIAAWAIAKFDFLPRHAAEYQMGCAVRCAAVQRAGDGRIRGGIGGLGAYSRRDQHHAATG